MQAVRKGKKYEYPFYTFAQFESRSNQIANYLTNKGVQRGMRVLLFVRPRLDFSVITFALFKLGAIPVLIDPGMGKKNLLKAIQDVRPQVMIAESIVHWMAFFHKEEFKNIQLRFKVNELLQNILSAEKSFNVFEAKDDDTAAILFTSGGTGTPKGVLTTHGILQNQTRMLQETFKLNELHVDLPGFPLFALFTLAMGMTSVIPDLDPTKPAHCNPEFIVRTILDQQVTFAAGSPAIWERVAQYCLQKNIQLPSIRHIAMFGAPVRGELHQMFSHVLPFGTTHTPYGATECLPVSTIDGKTILTETWAQSQLGFGTCVGRAISGNTLSIRIASDIPKGFPDEVGEILVQGPTVTPGYFANAIATANSKIGHKDGLMHRMGDVGWMDEKGQLWFCGRMNHVVSTKVQTYYPIPVEAIFNQHPSVKRSALVKITLNNEVVPAIVVELKNTLNENQLFTELRLLAQKFNHTSTIEHFFIHSGFPVDVRHNIKIDRIALSKWAQGLVS